MPCDTYLVNTINSEFVDCIDNIENVLHSYDFNHIIITGDSNTSFSRDNAQSKCLSEFLVRNNIFVSWEHPAAKRGNTNNNLSLGHHSFIDHFLSLDTHKRSIDKLYNFIIHSCISASEKCIPMGATGARPVPGWKDQVKPEREQSFFWH